MIEQQVKDWVKNNLPTTFKFREHQLEIIIDIVSKITENKQSNQVIEAPTGSGKSIIILIAAGVLDEYYGKKSYILCSDLSLWDQYFKAIKGYKLDYGYLKGQTNNYKCKLNGNAVRCGECRIAGKSWSYLMSKKENGFPCSKSCSYVKDRKRAINKNVTLMTYQCFLYTFMHHDDLESSSENKFTPSLREVIFCDECHHLADIVSSQFNPSISMKDIELAADTYKFLQNNKIELEQSVEDFKNKLIELYDKLKDPDLTNDQNLDLISQFYQTYNILWEAVKSIEDYYTDNFDSLSSNKKLEAVTVYRTFENIIMYGDKFRDLIGYLPSSNYLVKEVSDKLNLSFYNVKQDFLVYKCLLNKCNHRIMLSATVGDIETFKDNIGVKYLEENKEVDFKRIPSTFDFSKSPIYVYDKYPLSWKNKEYFFPKIKALTYEIVSKFEGKKGIIQTTSYTDALSIYNDAPEEIKERILLYNNSSEKDIVLWKHRNTENSILLGPTLIEGIDLPDDLCRFIIITKVPYPQLNNQLTKKKMELFKNWYDSTSSLNLIQAIGRGVRNETDYCETYILDACFLKLIQKTFNQYPEELVKRLYIEQN